MIGEVSLCHHSEEVSPEVQVTFLIKNFEVKKKKKFRNIKLACMNELFTVRPFRK